MQQREMRDRSRLYSAAHGAWRSYFLETGVILAVSRGVQVSELAPHLIRDGQCAIASYGRCLYMVDACEPSRIDTQLREALTGWLSANRHRATMHVLLRSKLLEAAGRADDGQRSAGGL
jgi:hypothetical protein